MYYSTPNFSQTSVSAWCGAPSHRDIMAGYARGDCGSSERVSLGWMGRFPHTRGGKAILPYMLAEREPDFGAAPVQLSLIGGSQP